MAYDGSVKFDSKIDSKGFQNDLAKMKSASKAAFAAVGAAAAAGVGAAVKVGMDFEAQMSKVGAISMASTDDMKVLTEKAKEMGETTVFSASQAGEAFEYMAMAGWKTEEMTAGIAGIMDLAAASGENLGTVSDIVTDALTAFGLSAQDSGRFADVLAAASSNANTNVSMMGETFKYVAPLAGSLGYSVEDTAVAIGLMANSGIKAGQAGTSLRSILTRLAKPPKEAAAAMKKLGLSITDSSGKIKPFNVLMKDMRKAFSKLDDAQKPTYAAMLGGQEAMSGLLSIVNASEKDFDKLTKAVENADGTAKEMADRNLDNLKGALTLAGSAAEGLGIAVYKGIEKPLKSAVNSGTKQISELTKSFKSGELSGALENVGALFGNLVNVAVSLATAVLPPLISVLSFAGQHFALIAGTIITAKTAMLAYKGAVAASTAIEATAAAVKTAHAAGVSGLNIVIGLLNGNLMKETTLTAAKTVAEGAATAGTAAHAAAQTALNTAMSLFPIGLVIAGLAALVVGIGIAVAATDKETEAEKAKREAVEENRKANDDLIKSIDDVRQAREKGASDVRSESAHVSDLAHELETLTDANGRVDQANRARAKFIIDTLNGALGTEIKLTDDMRVNYGKAKDAIYELITAKKAEALANVYQEDYENSMHKQKELADALAKAKNDAIEPQKKLTQAEQEHAKSIEDLNRREELLKKAFDDGKISQHVYNSGMKDIEKSTEAVNKKLDEAKNTYAPYQESIDKATKAVKENKYVITQSEEAFEALADGDANKAIMLFDSLGDAAVASSKDTDEALKQLGSNYQSALIDLDSAIENFSKTGTKAAYRHVVECAEKVADAKTNFEAAGGITAEAYGKMFIETMDGVIDINPLVSDIITNSQAMEKSATDAGYNTEKALGGNMDTLAGKILTAKSNADDFSTSLNNIPKTVNVDIKLNVPGILHLARGTRGAPGGPAVVNDGNGPELIQSKNGEFKMVQSKGAALTWLDRGDRVYTAEQTRAMMKRVPHYAKGTGNGGAYTGTVSITSFVEDVPEAFDKAMDELELRRDLDVIDEAQYYAELEKLRDKYFAKGSDKWWEYEKEIYNYCKERAKKEEEDARDAELDAIDRRHDLGLLSEQAYIAELTVLRDKYYAESTEEYAEMTDKINDISRQNERDMLEYKYDLGIITEREYYDKLTEYRDKYFAVGSKDWLDYTKDIYQYHVDEIKAAYDKLAEIAKETLEDIESKQEALSQKLSDDASFYRTVTIKNAYEDGSDMVFKELKDWTPDIEKLKRYNDAIDAVKDRILSGGFEEKYAKKFIDKLMEESVEDGTELAELLAKATDEEFKNHLDGYITYQKESEKYAAHQYETEKKGAENVVEAIEKGCDEALKDVKETFFGGMTEALEEAGLTVPEGFFDIGEISAEYFGEGFSDNLDEIYKKIKEQFNFDVVGGLALGVDGGKTTISTFAPVYNFNVANETTTQMIQSAQAATERDKLSGGY